MEKTMEQSMKKSMEKGMEKVMEKSMEKVMEKGMEKVMEKGMQKGMEKSIEKSIEKGMEKEKKYVIIDNIVDDAPFLNINWCTISFLSSEKIEKTKYLGVRGFKIHNGYNTPDMADADARLIKEKYPEHDVYIMAIGKIYGWDDATRADNIEYSDKKLNDLEKNRRENVDKIKLMSEQFKNEKDYGIKIGDDESRKEKIARRLRKQLYDKGVISETEYNMLKTESRSAVNIKKEEEEHARMTKEMMECANTDYLPENPPVAFKYACVTIYSPKHIKGLSTLCIKVRGMFEDEKGLKKRIAELKQKYPYDRIYSVPTGQWVPYTEEDLFDPKVLLIKLNYAMKCHMDNMIKEKEEFESRKEEMIKKNEQQANAVKKFNAREKRKERKNKKKNLNETTKPAESATESSDKSTETKSAEEEIPSLINQEPKPLIGTSVDDEKIRAILEYIEDSEIKDRFITPEYMKQEMTINIKN